MAIPDKQLQLELEYDPLVPAGEAARRLGVAVISVRRWAAAGRLPLVRLGRAVRFRQSDLERISREGLK